MYRIEVDGAMSVAQAYVDEDKGEVLLTKERRYYNQRAVLSKHHYDTMQIMSVAPAYRD